MKKILFFQIGFYAIFFYFVEPAASSALQQIIPTKKPDIQFAVVKEEPDGRSMMKP